MATQRILIDSSLIIDYFRKKKKDKAPLYQLFQRNNNLFISTLTIYELLCGAKNEQLQNDTEKILALFNVIEFGTIEASKAANLYKLLKKQNKIIETIDILIAATALSHSLSIATLNKAHFIRFQDLQIVNL